jgi:hypothetical protein
MPVLAACRTAYEEENPMERRKFLASSLAAASAAVAAPHVLAQGGQGASGASKREFYQLRRYQLATGRSANSPMITFAMRWCRR